jgi:hypothetical protein
MDIVPTFPDSQLTDLEMRTAILIWLGAPIPWLAGTGVIDPLGRSVLCDSTAARIARHDGVNAVIADFLVEAGCIVWDEVTGAFGARGPAQAPAPRPPLRERAAAVVAAAAAAAVAAGAASAGATASSPPAPPQQPRAPALPPALPPRPVPAPLPHADGPLPGEQRMADIVAYHLGTGWRPIIDTTVIDGATQALLAAREALTKPLTGVTNAERDKALEYAADTPDGFGFFPFGMG